MTSSVLRGVRVYRNGRFGDPEDVVIEGSVIGTDASGARDVESGGYLIPGLIDCHVHVIGRETLATFASFGVTTVLDMGNPMSLLNPLRGLPGVADLRAAGVVSTSPTSVHAQRMHAGPEVLVVAAAEADAWVSARVEEGADYIKVVIDLPGFDQETVDALVAAAHARGKKVVAHASRFDAVTMAQRAGVDILTQVPLDRPLESSQAAELAAAGAVVVPTLTMMKGIVEGLKAAGAPGPVYEPARASVAVLHDAGMPILAGTDANAVPFGPSSPPFGESLHQELGLLVEAGLSPVEALDAATSVAADHFGLDDRGRIAAGLRADLVLLDADPTADIAATRSMRGVWIAGQRIQKGRLDQ
ncbi:amidohydrolase family protein [Cryobacterium sp. GrIS_2_6]|uniref:amidohydrolase family protein n=1 Tax=Cryobacterium sp. GrIS_2_6 TaxID=3162785 RepID=UPI002E04F319|nr:amidohydrolase family protein [Cryobacterium psychrotolerans]MEC5151936.1 imidazolonepropionase-like amidohydrolase [Cryobacterium psychrotolerans]